MVVRPRKESFSQTDKQLSSSKSQFDDKSSLVKSNMSIRDHKEAFKMVSEESYAPHNQYIRVMVGDAQWTTGAKPYR